MNGKTQNGGRGTKPLIPQGQVLARPASRGLVFGSIIGGFLLTALPWPQAALWLVPDFVVITLIYWNIHAPRMANLGLAFVLGLAVDAAHGILFGMHALAYCSATFVVLLLRRRLENFSPSGQALQLAWLFPAQEALVLIMGLAFGRDPDWRYLAAGVITAMLWWPVSALLDRISGRAALPEAGEG